MGPPRKIFTYLGLVAIHFRIKNTDLTPGWLPPPSAAKRINVREEELEFRRAGVF